jgi:hypothetical protein
MEITANSATTAHKDFNNVLKELTEPSFSGEQKCNAYAIGAQPKKRIVQSNRVVKAWSTMPFFAPTPHNSTIIPPYVSFILKVERF